MGQVTPCRECGQNFAYEPFMIGGVERFRPTLCDRCDQLANQKAEETAKRRKEMDMQIGWEAICPPIFRETDETRVPAWFLAAVKNWPGGSRGLGFVGDAGTCKTRSAYLLLKAQHFAGRKCAAATATALARMAVEQFSNDLDARAYAVQDLRALKHSRVTLIDDLGKGRMSDRAEMELFDLLDYRTSHGLPTIWTANAGGEELAQMMSDDRRDPIMRRLVEFSDIPRRESKH